MSRRALELLLRGLTLAAATALAGYALLVDLPFTYQAVLRAGLFPWLAPLARVAPWLLAVAALAQLLPRRAGLPLSWLQRGLLVLLAALGSGWGVGGLATLQPGLSARILALGAPALSLVLHLLDLLQARSSWPQQAPEADDARRLLGATLMTGLGVALASGLLGLLRAIGAAPSPTVGSALTTLGWSLTAHGLVASLAAVALLALQSLSALLPQRPWAGYPVFVGAGIAAGAAFLHAVVFPPLAFQGALAWAMALLLAGAWGTFLGTVGLALADPQGGDPQGGDPLGTWLRPLHPLPSSRSGLGASVAGALLILGLLHLRLAQFDWNQMGQQVGMALVAALLFAALYLRWPREAAQGGWGPRILGAPLAFLLLYLGWAQPRLHPAPGGCPRPSAPAVEAHLGFDGAARLVASLVRTGGPEASSLYPVLLANSNLPHSLPLTAKDLRLVEPLGRTAGLHPDIYVFVVDSLRQDYLGCYNPAVTFTPNLDRFARESTIFPKAFTRYGATGLSEPSIWVGGMLLHKQYIVPFHPLNTLQKLLDAEGYRPLISMDSILEVIVPPTPGLIRLDADKGTSDLRLGATLEELRVRLPGLPKEQPVFVYTQAQDLHISTLTREGKDVPGGGTYPGFYAPYAARVRRLDAAFGSFIQFLKDQGRYDRSLILFTADHGDSLGEGGRFGHAYTLFPEIMKVPILVHLPPALQAQVVADTTRPAFLTDLTPSLYYLLGHRDLRDEPVLGRPLFTAQASEQARFPARDHLIASSYGAVWGLISGDGASLYVADAVNLKDACFDLGPPGQADPPRELNAETKRDYDARIHRGIDHLNAFYGFQPGKGTP